MIEVNAFFAAFLLVTGHAQLKKDPDGFLGVVMVLGGALNFAQMVGALVS